MLTDEKILGLSISERSETDPADMRK